MSLICKLISHKWREFIVTGRETVERNIPSGYGVSLGTQSDIVDVGYWKERDFCLRCGQPNPNRDTHNG